MFRPRLSLLLLLTACVSGSDANDPRPFDDLGHHHRTISTSSPRAQRWFDQARMRAKFLDCCEGALAPQAAERRSRWSPARSARTRCSPAWHRSWTRFVSRSSSATDWYDSYTSRYRRDAKPRSAAPMMTWLVFGSLVCNALALGAILYLRRAAAQGLEPDAHARDARHAAARGGLSISGARHWRP